MLKNCHVPSPGWCSLSPAWIHIVAPFSGLSLLISTSCFIFGSTPSSSTWKGKLNKFLFFIFICTYGCVGTILNFKVDTSNFLYSNWLWIVQKQKPDFNGKWGSRRIGTICGYWIWIVFWNEHENRIWDPHPWDFSVLSGCPHLGGVYLYSLLLQVHPTHPRVHLLKTQWCKGKDTHIMHRRFLLKKLLL